MICHYRSQLVFLTTLISHSFGVIITIVSIICVLLSTSMNQSLRTILFSFCIANLLGTCMLTYDTMTLICTNGNDNASFVVTITVMLSLSHLMLLMLSEHLYLKSQWALKVKNFVGLIFISWIISVTSGTLNVVTIRQEARVVFAVALLVGILSLLTKYIYQTKQRQILRHVQEEYNRTFLRGNSRRHKMRKYYWNIKYYNIILSSYIMCTLPWIMNEFRESLRPNSHNSLIHWMSLIVYSVNFYFPSAVCIHLMYRQRRRVQRRKRRSVYMNVDMRVRNAESGMQNACAVIREKSSIHGDYNNNNC